MAKFIVQWKYGSSLGGLWQKGDVVDLDPQQAEAIGKDSPGVLIPADPARQEQPHKDRQLKGGSNRKEAENE